MTFDRDHFSPEVYDARDAEFFFENGRGPWRRWDLFKHLEHKFINWIEPARMKKLVYIVDKVAVPDVTGAFDFLLTLTDEELVEACCSDDKMVPEWITDLVRTTVGRRLTERSLRLGEEDPPL